ncbi:MAG: hypothetical protein MR353_05045 [Spirochaetia bacterium]|nr:hypothetical protein [Spirochaetia bacterium]
MKKGFIFLLTFLFFNAAIFAEQIQSQQNEETVQTISWEIVENANKYQVEIEKFNSSIDSENQWEAFYTETTSLSQVEVTFIPGRYRIKVMPVNILGRVVDQGQWLKFRILTEAEWAEWEKQHSKGENQPVFEDETEDDNQNKEKSKKQNIFFKAIRLGFDVPVYQPLDFTMNMKLSADVIGTKWFFWNTGFVLSPKLKGTILTNSFEVKGGMETSVNFRIPFKNASPYAGIAAGYYLFNENGICAGEKDMYVALAVGTEFLKYGDVKVYFGMDDILNSQKMFLSVGAGGIIPLK